MKLLAGVSYDPAAAVTKNTTALLAMTALDTTNLRLASITVPSHGMLRWRIICTVHGATTLPSILLGVMEGATVRGRIAPMVGGGNLIATGRYQHEATGLITGLTPASSITLDAAYGVEVIVASTGIKYGGPNNTTTNDAFGAIVFEVFDPAPAAGSGSGATAQEVWEYATRSLTDKAGFGLADSAITAAKIAAAALNDKGNWNVGKTGYALSVTPPTAAQIRTEMDTSSTKLANLDAAVSTRLASASYTAPDNATITAINAKTTNLPSDPADQSLIIAATDTIRADIAAIEPGGSSGPTAAEIRAEMDANSTKLANLDAAVSTRMATFTYTAPDNAGIAAVKAKTDQLVFTDGTNCLHTDVCYINGIQVIGAGVNGNPWRAA